MNREDKAWARRFRWLSGGLLCLVAGIGAPLCANEFYVGREGDDANPGTRMQPFRTLGHAAEAMAPGDVCIVSRGLYRETVRPPRSGRFEAPIRFMAATGETVTVSGTTELTGWEMEKGAVYRVAAARALQVLVDDQPAIPVTGLAEGPLSATARWGQDTNGWLYAQMPNNDAPATHRVEAQTRLWGFDLTGLAHVEIKGFNVFAAGIALRGAEHCRVEDCHVWWAGAGEDGGSRGTAAIVVGGKDNEVLLTSLVGSAGSGVVFEPDAINNRLLNCLIRGTGLRASGAYGVVAAGTAQIIRQMTIVNCAGGAILCTNLLNGRIEYCDLQHTGQGGSNVSVAAVSGDGKGTVMAFNWIHDNQSAGGDGITLGARSENYILHRNVVWGQPGSGFRLAGGARYSFICNNTVALCGAALDTEASDKPDFKGMRLVNNILAGRTWASRGGRVPDDVVWQKNFEGEAAGFVDVSNRNFRLASGSPCLNAGQEEPEFTEGFVGDRPDQGAYESGGEDWVPGCRASESANQVVRPAIRLVLECMTPGSEIRYTLDGRDPTAESPLYTGAISFGQGVSVRARAFGRGMEPSPVSSVWVRQDP